MSSGSSAARSRDDAVVHHQTMRLTSKICGVCGDIARCYHFGGLCCASCKAFFRRAVVNGQYKSVGFQILESSLNFLLYVALLQKVSVPLWRILQNRCDNPEALLPLPIEALPLHRYGQEMVCQDRFG